MGAQVESHHGAIEAWAELIGFARGFEFRYFIESAAPPKKNLRKLDNEGESDPGVEEVLTRA